MQLRRIASVLAAGALAITSMVGANSAAIADETPAVAQRATVPAAMPLSTDPKVKAWQDLRFGLFIHWGVYSQYAGYVGDKRQSKGYPEQIKAWEKISDADYLATASQMTIPDFNPQKWCQDAKDAGMKYLLVTSKHHDGFTMFNSETTTFDFADAAPGQRDPMKELADACQAIDMKLGFYFSIIDWTKQTPEPNRNLNPIDDELMNLIKAQLQELLSGKYGQVPELWFDMGGPTPEQSAQLAAWVREFSPNTMVNSRVWNDKGDFEVGGDNALVSTMTLNPWESIRSTFPRCWGYCRWPEIEAVRNSENGVAEQTHHEVENLFTTVANGGQYLLNVGPKGSGAFDPFESKILEGIGAWNSRHPHVIHGAVPTYYPSERWGYAVINGDAIYLGIKRWEDGAEIRLQGAGANVTGVEIDDASNPGQVLNYRVDPATNDVFITLPQGAPDPVLPVIKVTTQGEPTYDPAHAAQVEKGKVSTVSGQGISKIASPKSGAGVAQNIAYVRNSTDEPLNLIVSGEGRYANTLPLSVHIGQTSVETNAVKFADGINGFTLPAHSVARVIIEKGQKEYYAEGMGGYGREVNTLHFLVEDPTKQPVTVHHEFVSADENPLPEQVTAILPADRTASAGVPTVSASTPEQRVVLTDTHTWTFQGWDAEKKAVEGAERIVFTGRWQAGPLIFPVSFTYASGSPDHEFPLALEYMTMRDKQYEKGASVTFDPPRSLTFRDSKNAKTWRFARWEPASVESLSGPLAVRGIWEYQPDQDVTAEYTFVASDGSQLPDEVMALLPAAQKYDAPVKQIYPAFPEPTTIAVPGGEWIFSGYDRSISRWPAGPSETFTGTWRFQKTRHTISFTYVSADESVPLPENVTTRAPRAKKITEGDNITFDRPIPASVAVEGGVWTFDSWDRSELTNVSEAAEITGTWSFHPGEVGTPTYTFKSGTEDVELPEFFAYLLPEAEPYIVGGTALPPTIPNPVMSFGGSPWKFVGWTPEKIDNAPAGAAFVGTWVKTPEQLNVTYVFESANGELPDAVKALLPEASMAAWGATHTAVELEKTRVDTIEGTWTFNGWDKPSAQVEDDVTFTGTWTFTQRDYLPVYRLDNLPEQVASAHDTTKPVVFRGNTVCAPEPVGTVISTDDATWTFTGYEKACYGLDEIEQFATVAGLSATGATGGALFVMAENPGMVYKLPFTPKWSKEDKPGQADPGDNGAQGGASGGDTGSGSAGSGNTGGSETGNSTGNSTGDAGNTTENSLASLFFDLWTYLPGSGLPATQDSQRESVKDKPEASVQGENENSPAKQVDSTHKQMNAQKPKVSATKAALAHTGSRDLLMLGTAAAAFVAIGVAMRKRRA